MNVVYECENLLLYMNMMHFYNHVSIHCTDTFFHLSYKYMAVLYTASTPFQLVCFIILHQTYIQGVGQLNWDGEKY